jgi:hypothetical protein
MSFIYIASPYTHQDPNIMQQRYEDVAEYTAILIRQNLFALSPIVHGHYLALAHNLPGDYSFWENYSKALLRASSSVRVYCIPGWEESKGVRAEIELAEKLSKPVTYWQYKFFKR